MKSGEARETSEYFHDIHEIKITESHQIAAESDMEQFSKVQPLFENTRKKKKSETLQEQCIRAEKETVDSHSLSQDCIVGQDGGKTKPSRSDDTMPVAWAERSTTLWRSHTRWNVMPNAVVEENALVADQFRAGGVWLNKIVMPLPYERKWTSSSLTNDHT